MTKIIIASGPVIVEDNKVLLNKHNDSFWKFCGGKLETLEEGLFEGAQREAREEMGIDIEKIKDEPYLMYTPKPEEKEKIDVILVHFLCKRIGEIKPGADIEEWAWIDIDDLKNYDDLAPNIIPTLKHFKFL